MPILEPPPILREGDAFREPITPALKVHEPLRGPIVQRRQRASHPIQRSAALHDRRTPRRDNFPHSLLTGGDGLVAGEAIDPTATPGNPRGIESL